MVDINHRSIQLCGPISGMDYMRRCNVFSDAKDACWRAGAIVWSPTDHVPHDASHEDAMRICLAHLLGDGIDVLVTLPGWEASEGACLEVAVAKAVGVPVMTLEEAVACPARPR